MKSSREDKDKLDSHFVKTVKRFSLSRIYESQYHFFDRAGEKFSFYDFNIEGSGFLRRQVRVQNGI